MVSPSGRAATAPPPAGGGRNDHAFRTGDPEEFGLAAAPRAPSRLVLRAEGQFLGLRRRLEIGHGVVSRGWVSLPATFHNEVGPRVVFALPPAASAGQARYQGQPMPPDALALWRPGSAVHTQWPGGTVWWNLIFPAARAEAAHRAVFGADLPQPSAGVSFVPIPPGGEGAIRALVARARAAPSWVAGDRLADGLLAALLRLVALHQGPPAAEAIAGRRRQRVADALVAIGDRAEEDPRSLLDVCAELGVPLRTLNAASNALLGLSAAAYLRRRRLQRVRAELLQGAAASVTEAATRHGFWELGRFSAAYRAQFGEAPSETLRGARSRGAD